MNTNVVIIGAGVAGLSAAYNMCKRGLNPIILEKEQSIGGLLKGSKIKKYFIENFYHHIFHHDTEFLNLLKELNIYNKLSWNKASSGSIDKNGLYDLTSPQDILFFKPLNFLEKIRLVYFVLKIKTINDFKKYDNILAEDWIIDNAGEEVYKRFFKPLLKGKYGPFLDKVSAGWLISRIKMRSERSIFGESLGYLDDGFNDFLEKIKSKIKEFGGKIITGAEVREIRLKGNMKEIKYRKSGKTGSILSENVISTVPIPMLIRICDILPSNYRSVLSKIRYEGSISILLGIRKKLSKIYWLNVMDESYPFGAIIEHRNFYNSKKYGDDNIVYLASYVSSESELFNKPDKEIIVKYLSYLKKLFDISEDDIKWVKVVKERYGSPIYNVNYLKIKPHPTTPIKNFFLAGMPVAYPERTINDSIKSGIEVSNMVAK